jgi:3-oxoacyl-[acyl-carrier protein] reductase
MAVAEAPWVVVAGAAGSLGGELSRRYAAAGRKLLMLDQTPVSLEAAAPIATLESRAVDLADADAVQQVLTDAIPRSDAIGLLINAAGLIWNEPVLSLKGTRFVAHDAANWDNVLRANLTTAFVTGTRVAARMARAGGGGIINLSSISATGNIGQIAYAAAKAGIEGLTRAMAQELGPLDIRVNAIAPGFVDAASTRSALSAPVLNDYIRRTPLRRLATLDDLAAAVDAIENNKFMTGTIVALDGGLRL